MRVRSRTKIHGATPGRPTSITGIWAQGRNRRALFPRDSTRRQCALHTCNHATASAQANNSVQSVQGPQSSLVHGPIRWRSPHHIANSAYLRRPRSMRIRPAQVERPVLEPTDRPCITDGYTIRNGNLAAAPTFAGVAMGRIATASAPAQRCRSISATSNAYWAGATWSLIETHRPQTKRRSFRATRRYSA